MRHGSRMTELAGGLVTVRTVRDGFTLTLHGVLWVDEEGYAIELPSSKALVRILADDVVTAREFGGDHHRG